MGSLLAERENNRLREQIDGCKLSSAGSYANQGMYLLTLFQ